MSFDMQDFLQDFLTEAGEHITALDDALMASERLVNTGSPLDEDLVNRIFRSMHTLKGMAGMMSFTSFQRLAHEIEQIFDEVRAGKRRLVPAEHATIFDGFDGLKRLFAQLEATGSEQGVDVSQALEAVEALARGASAGAAPARSAPAGQPASGGPPQEDLLAWLDPYDQTSVLVEVAKGRALYHLEVRPAADCTEVTPAEWLAGLSLVGTVLGVWTREGAPVEPAGFGALPAGAEALILIVTEADRQSMLDATGLPEARVLKALLPWAEEVPASEAPQADLLSWIDPYDQTAILVEVAKGASLLHLEVEIGRDCVEATPAEWRQGVETVGKVLGMWLPSGQPLNEASFDSLTPDSEALLLLLTRADRESVLDCTNLPETALFTALLPWGETPATPAAPASPAPAASVQAAPAPVPAPVASAPAASVPAPVAPMPAPASAPPAASVPAPKPPAPAPAAASERATSIRVETVRLDRLMELVGELVIHHTRLNQLNQEMADLSNANGSPEDLRARIGTVVGAFEEAMQSVGRVSDELQESTMKIRMMPVGTLFNRFPRILRDLARECGKVARLEIVGAETELDKTVIEQIGDPLIHLLRNAVDHGLESVEERMATNKAPEGVVTLAASQQGQHIVIVVSDDGKGIPHAKILAKAKERGLVGEHEQLSEAEILQLIFRPGFSTAEKVTSISGRGVGMDVVQANIKKLGGSIQVLSEPGQGSRFVIKLPLTLAIAKALLVRASEHTFSIPLATVEETLRIKRSEIKTLHEREVIQVRGEVLPLFRLAQIFDLPLSPVDPEAHLPVVVVGDGELSLGLVVDTLIGQQDVVVKSLGDFLGQVSGIAGATILGDGGVALIVDVQTLIGQSGSAREAALAEAWE